jgi:Zn-dependent protease
VIQLVEGVLTVGALLVCVIPHEIAHGYVAWRLGDPTAKRAGRLSLNPLRHLDPIGSLLFPAALLLLRRLVGFPIVFGWAKPVPINPNYFRNPWKGMLWVALAGPATNFLLAGVVAAVGRGLVAVGFTNQWVLFFLAMVVLIGLVLGLFNLLPVPPLDGSRILAYFLPPRWRWQLTQLEQVGVVIIMVLILLGVLELVFRGASRAWLALVGWKWAILIGFLL